MTSPPSPPNRRRRRVVVAIAVLVIGLGWWFWPRVDQRFVGTWDDGAGTIWHFNEDGSFRRTGVNGTPSGSLWWRINGSDIAVYSNNQAFATSLWHMFRRLSNKKVYATGFEEYPVTRFDGEALQLDYGLYLHRVASESTTR